MPSLSARVSSAAQSWLAAATKDIWGRDYQTFMGMNASGGGSEEIQDSPGDYARAVTAEAFVFRAITVRGNGIAQAPLRCWTLDKSGQRQEAVDHDSLAVLDYTNPMKGSVRGLPNLMRYTLGAQDTHGHSAWLLAFNRRGTMPTEIYWQPPATYQVVRDRQKNFGGIVLNGQPADPIPPERVVYLPSPNLADPLTGTSKIKVLRSAINLRRAGVASNQAFFSNSQRPDWILSGNFLNTEDNVARIRRVLRRWMTGENNRSPLILGENAKATLLTMSAKDAEWIQQQRLSGEEISMVFGVPVIYLNNFEHGTYDNLSTAKIMLWHDGIIPEANALASALTRDFLWEYWPETAPGGRARMEYGFDYSRVDGLSEDVNRQVERVLNVWREIGAFVQDGALTPNMARPMLRELASQLGLPTEGFDGDVPGGNISERVLTVMRELGAFVQDGIANPNGVRRLLVKLAAEMSMPADAFTGDIMGGDETLDLYTKIPRSQHSVQTIIDVMAARGENPELVEDVPGAPRAGQNARAAADRRAPATPPPAPTASGDSPAGQDKDPVPSPAPAGKAIDLVEVAEIVRRTVREEARALRPHKARSLPHPVDVRDRRLKAILDGTHRSLKVYFQDLQKEALRTLRGPKGLAMNGEAKALPATDESLFDHQAAQTTLHGVIADGVIRAARAAWGAANEDYGLDVAWQENHPFVADYMGLRTARIRGINLTTQQAIKDALSASAQEGESTNQAADRISDVFRDAIDNRAETIARSELIPAYNMASVRAYREAAVEKAQMYDGTDDPECAAVDGQVVGLDEAEQLIADEHPNGTRGVAPYLESSSDELEAAAFNFDRLGVSIA